MYLTSTDLAIQGEWLDLKSKMNAIFDTAEEQYFTWMEQLPHEIENIIWNMMTVKAPLQNAFETGTRVLHIPCDADPRIVSMEDDSREEEIEYRERDAETTSIKKMKQLIGGQYEGLWLWGKHSMYMKDYDMDGPINRFVFKHLGLVVRGDVVLVCNDDDGNKTDYIPVVWKDMERQIIKRGLLFHYIHKQYMRGELRACGLIDMAGKRL